MKVNMIHLTKNSLDISLKNWPVILAFDMMYKGFSYSILYAITSDLLSLILKTAGVPYVSAENLHVILLNPISLFLCLCTLLITAISVFFETVAFYVYCETGWHQQRISIIELLKCTVLQCKKLIHAQNIFLFLGFIIATILTVMPFSPYILQWLSIPEFIMDFIKNDKALFLFFCIATLIANFICFLFLFFLPYTLFKNQPIKVAWKEGLLLLKKRKIVTFFRVLGAFAIFSIVVVILLSIALTGLVTYTKYIESPSKVIDTFTVYFYRAVPVAIFIIGWLATIWLFSVLITLFHQYRDEKRPSVTARNKVKKTHRIKQVAIILCATVAILMFSESELGGAFINQTYTKLQIIAHRSGAASAPENTMAALDNAITTGVDMVEIDVQQLKDGSLILLHDSSFNRTTGENKKVWEVDYSDIEKYDAGSWFSPEFAGEPIPLLDDILKRAKDNIQVMIELKFTGHEDNVVRSVIELIEAHDMLDNCNIGSLNLEILKEVKDINPKIETVYITPLIFSSQYDIDFIDAFSVETTMITREMVASMHLQGKDVYGWTANSKDTIQKNLRCQVNGIVTDYPELVRYYTMQTWKIRLLDMLIQIFFSDYATR